MYWQGANIMLTVGLVTEALVFFMSAFEKPLKTYEWDKVIDFESGKLDLRIDPRSFVPPAPSSSDDVPTQHFPSATPPVHYPQAPAFPGVTNIEGLSDEDAQKLNMSIQNLTRTASQLNEIASFSWKRRTDLKAYKLFQKTCQVRSKSEALFKATDILLQLYERIGEDTEKIEVNTQEYRNKERRSTAT